MDHPKKPFHFVLVHGGSHGAWCWYKLVDLLQKSGHRVSALDLAGCGIHPSDPENIASFTEYTQPLLDFFHNLEDSDKVVLVGHSLGGLSLMHASQLFPRKIAVAVYVVAAMFLVGRKHDAEINLAKICESFPEMMQYTFGNGVHNPPTTVMLSKQYARDKLYHLCPSQDVVLASLLARPSPVAALSSLNFDTTEEGYGSVPSVFIKTEEDKSFLPAAQDIMINKCRPNQVFSLHSDHSPFFSAPQDLQQILLKVAGQYCSSLSNGNGSLLCSGNGGLPCSGNGSLSSGYGGVSSSNGTTHLL